MNRTNWIRLVSLLIGAATALAALILMMTGTIGTETGIIILVIGLAVCLLGMLAANYKTSAYGGKFHSRYPDAK